MKFRNNLIMSALLVTSFLCLHFYEESVKDKYAAYDTFLYETAKDKEENTYYFPEMIRVSMKRIGLNYEDLELLKQDIEAFERLENNPELKDLIASKQVTQKYDIDDELLIRNNRISSYALYEFYSKMLEELSSMYIEYDCLAAEQYDKDLRLIIKEINDVYELNRSYDLDFRVVNLTSGIKSTYNPNMKLYIEIDEVNHSIDQFPLELQEKPKSFFLRAEVTNEVTGEKQNIRRRFDTDKIDYP